MPYEVKEYLLEKPLETPERTIMVESLPCMWPPCPFGNTHSKVEVLPSSMEELKAGAHIQHAFPYLSADMREMLMTGFHPECFAQIFEGDEEEGD